jgi:hypothetical protein
LPDTDLAGMRGRGRWPKANPGRRRRVIMWDEGPAGREESRRSATGHGVTRSRQSVEPVRKRFAKKGGKDRRDARSRKQKATKKRGE